VNPWVYIAAGLVCLAIAMPGGAPGRDVRPALPLRLSAGAYRFRESLFLLPAVIVVAGVALAEATAAADRAALGGTWTLRMNSNAATWLLSVVAGATITTAGVVFSLTVVSLQLASSQFSPRVMRSFIRDRLSQVVIGSLVATFCFCVLTLRHVHGPDEAPAPRISLTVAVVLTVATVLLIVAHLDHLARRLQVGEVVRAIAQEGDDVLLAMRRTAAEERPGARADGPPSEQDMLVVPAARDGWVTQASSRRMFAAVPPGTKVWLETRTGAYVHKGEALLVLWPMPAQPGRVTARLSAAVAVADTRTMQEDVDFAVRQLVDIGLRALSPAINDPTTAVEVILRLGSLMRRLLLIELPPETVEGPDGRSLVRPWALRHDEYMDHAFDQLRQAAAPQTQVLAALLRVMRMLILHVELADRTQHVPALRDQLDMVLDACRDGAGLHPRDLQRLAALADDRTDPADHRRSSRVTPARPDGRRPVPW
jgi:uncharacterized membrane protein